MNKLDAETREHRKKSWLLNCFIILIGVILLFYIYLVFTGIKAGEYTLIRYAVEYGDSYGAIIASLAIVFVLIQLQESSKARLDAITIANEDRELSISLHKKELALTKIKEDLIFVCI